MNSIMLPLVGMALVGSAAEDKAFDSSYRASKLTVLAAFEQKSLPKLFSDVSMKIAASEQSKSDNSILTRMFIVAMDGSLYDPRGEGNCQVKFRQRFKGATADLRALELRYKGLPSPLKYLELDVARLMRMDWDSDQKYRSERKEYFTYWDKEKKEKH